MRPAAEDGVRAAPAAVVAHRTARIWRSQIYDPPEEGQIPPRASVGLADFARQRFRMDTVTNQQVIDWVVDMAAASGAPEDRRGWETEAVGYQGQVEVIIGDRCYSGPSDGSRWVAGECPWWERPDWLLRTLGSFVLTADIGAKDARPGAAGSGRS
jgi:hypothetical protein